MKRLLIATSALTLLSACGGGGGGGGSNGGTPAIPPQISLAMASGSASVTEGRTQTDLTTTATVTGSTSASAVIDLQYDKAVFASVTATAGATSGTYVVTAKTLPDLAPGDYKGNITARLCADTACTTVQTSAAYGYDVSVKLADWQTFQRNPAHTGYVRTTLDVTKFAKAWEWAYPNSTQYYGTGSLTTAGGNLIVTRSVTTGATGTVYAVNETTGTVKWSTDIPGIAYQGAAATGNGKVYVPAIGSSQNNAVFVFDAATGSYQFKSIFYAQWTLPGAPTPYGDQFYLASGTYGGQVSSHSQTSDDIKWRVMSAGGSAWGGESPAVDDLYVYYYTGRSLNVFDRSTGALQANIDDTLENQYGYDYYAAPVLAAPNSVIAFSGYGSGYYSGRLITRFDTASKTRLWRTTQGYSIQPAYAKGFIYTAKNSPPRLDVLNESDGSVAWYWVPPIADNTFVGNIIVTDNLVFASTDKAVYAIDIATRKSVWSYPISGELMLSPGYKLYIQPLYNGSSTTNVSSNVVAISLR